MTALLGDAPSALDRFASPLYTVVEAARYLDVPASTLTTWVKGYRRAGKGRPVVTGSPVLTTVPSPRRGPVIPFVGLAEGLVLTAMRRAGVPLQRIRPALALLDKELGLQHALASSRLFTDGAEVLYDYAETGEDEEAARAARELVVVRSDQRVFNEVVDAYLRRLEFADDGYVQLIRLPAYEVAEVVVDPARGFGQPIFARGGARLEDALALFRAGEPLDVVAAEYGIPRVQLEDAVRIATRVAA
ncbi:MAG: DUF433 domain-containing protein [Actinomycetota bacterium]|nr:DUF433 domain-containing protein [Actinomycetota bacterium]